MSVAVRAIACACVCVCVLNNVKYCRAGSVHVFTNNDMFQAGRLMEYGTLVLWSMGKNIILGDPALKAALL